MERGYGGLVEAGIEGDPHHGVVALDAVWYFFFQAEDGIRDLTVTGVQTCALPISAALPPRRRGRAGPARAARLGADRGPAGRGRGRRADRRGRARQPGRDRPGLGPLDRRTTQDRKSVV